MTIESVLERGERYFAYIDRSWSLQAVMSIGLYGRKIEWNPNSAENLANKELIRRAYREGLDSWSDEKRKAVLCSVYFDVNAYLERHE